MTQNPTHLTSNELAERLRVHVQTTKRWRVQGVGPKYLKFGKSVVYPIQEVEAWERQHLIQSTAEAK